MTELNRPEVEYVGVEKVESGIVRSGDVLQSKEILVMMMFTNRVNFAVKALLTP
jgi:hypothetical protein